MRGSYITRNRPITFELRIQVGVYLADRVDQIGQAFQRKVFTLHRHDHAMGAAQGR